MDHALRASVGETEGFVQAIADVVVLTKEERSPVLEALCDAPLIPGRLGLYGLEEYLWRQKLAREERQQQDRSRATSCEGHRSGASGPRFPVT
ncbi:hypothetical protein BOSEA31B_20452 [Hyphomicrobiales bacterium]|jgi:hypothetical protein|nr:hypothetical protein BOSEA31B_20452 [Hyphomicrobiales bacterium]CAH1702173.1 hypothetical protein BOSEA1005_30045 [Hyphomicrobiales bacterium]CAI0346377.1 hypothetical protein BO1005MUT1_510018 [Hyphomicrobiales bacterium]